MNTKIKIVPLTILSTILTFQIWTVNAQTSLKGINLNHGKHKVGFTHYTITDSTRNYRIHNEFNNQVIRRPIPISIWYPATAEKDNSRQLALTDYLEVLKEEEEWKNLPDEFLLDWFPYLPNTPGNKAHLSEKAVAFSNPAFLDGKFPVIVYAPSYQATSIENFALLEYLASNGYIVISSPSRGTQTRLMEGGTAKDMETQSRDVEFLLKEIHRYSNTDLDRIALMGYSFGGLSNAITVMKHSNIGAIVSLDGTERYNYSVLEKSPYFNLGNFTVPYIHFAQKEIPEEVLSSDHIPAELNHKFQLYDSLRYSDAYSYRFHDLTHSFFSSLGVLFAEKDKRQDKSDDRIMASYKLLSEQTLQFLNATLKDDRSAKRLIENSPDRNDLSDALISKKMKKADTGKFNFRDFNDIAFRQNYQDLVPLYNRTMASYPDLRLQEGMLNTLGLQLSFNSEKTEQGINVFLLALHIYPKSANLYDSLAEAYLHNKDFKNAIANYQKSLALDPENHNAIERLKQLKE